MQKNLYVANNLSDTISIINTATNQITDTIMLRPSMVRDIPGVSPVGLALSPNQKTLYVALGDMDAIGVINLKDHTVAGYIPAGWYPSALATDPSGKRLLIANARGTNFRNPNNHLDPLEPTRKNTAVLSNLAGNVSSISIPTGHALAKSTDASPPQQSPRHLRCRKSKIPSPTSPSPPARSLTSSTSSRKTAPTIRSSATNQPAMATNPSSNSAAM